jgi:large subunit ribosomal protein L31
MKDKIHPKYVDCKIICGCGNVIKTKSIKPEIRIEICSACHPFYTGQERLVDTAGRVDKFKERLEKAKKLQAKPKKSKDKKKKDKETKKKSKSKK